jgi:hypothetical protein
MFGKNFRQKEIRISGDQHRDPEENWVSEKQGVDNNTLSV